jgi:hypothetical protein
MSRLTVLAVLLALSGCGAETPFAPSDLDRDAGPRPDGARPPAPPTIVVGGGGSGGGSGSGDACGARVLVIFDRSGSMRELWSTPDGDAPRWQVAAEALEGALAPLADRLEVGAILFPSLEVDVPGECSPVDPIERQLDYADGATFLAAWRARWERPELFGMTPIDSAFESADAALPDDGAITAVVLLTDGEPTCAGEVAATTYASAWAARGIPTWVIGLPGRSGSATLDAIASAGDTGSALSVGDPAALTRALGEIAGDAVEQSCAR